MSSPQVHDVIAVVPVPTEPPLARREKRKQTNRARNRLLSVRRDAENLTKTLCVLRDEEGRTPPVLGNERCGPWYIDTRTIQMHDTCYFKSSDGHTKTWNFSLKRLNLNVIRNLEASETSSCIIVDASASKPMPDSLSRTIPIWACVLNRLVARYRKDLNLPLPANVSWDTALYTPLLCVPHEEHSAIESIIDERVWAVYESKAIVDPCWLVQTLSKPLRPTWILSNSVADTGIQDSLSTLSDQYFSVICVSCSDPHSPTHPIDFLYSPGAGDDHETWARGLNPSLFWAHHNDLLDGVDTFNATDAAIDRLIAETSTTATPLLTEEVEPYNFVGELRLAIGSRRAGRPPECWDTFDAVLNVTELAYDDMVAQEGKYYLQLPVREGKRDKIELERWMSVGIVFVAIHASYGRRILIHCAQGMDRSVAVTMAAIMALCESLTLPLRWRDSVLLAVRNEFGSTLTECSIDEQYGMSGITKTVVDSMVGQQGRNGLLGFIRSELGSNAIPATKDTLRLALLLIQQDRDKADPTRSTMQKLNRYFMSEIMFTP